MDQGSLVRTVAQSQIYGRSGGRCREQDAVRLSAQLSGFDRKRAENRCCGQFNELGKIRALGHKTRTKGLDFRYFKRIGRQDAQPDKAD